jgi:hypothetical protein
MSLHRVAAAALALLFSATVTTTSCAPRAASGARPLSPDRSPRIEDAFEGEPAFVLVVRPTKLTRDPLYGPLVRRASQLASARVAVAEAVGTTTLAALERTEEVILGAYDHDARDAVIALRGVPADIEASGVLDTNGKPLWTHVRDLPRGIEELAAADPSAGAALFVLPRRAWVVAVGPAVARARAAFAEGAHGSGTSLISIEDRPLGVARLRGAALLRARPSLADGALAPIMRDLDVVSVSLEPGPEGAVGEVAARFEYGDLPFAERAERCVADVLAAFTRKYETEAPWLHAIKVSRSERVVLVRGRIPRAWADGLLHVDLDDFAR